jgi:DNA polymerase III subunit delta
LLHDGENEIKILSILVRQFRMVDQCLRLLDSGITEPKAIAPKIGSHPFFVSKIIQQTKGHTAKSLGRALDLLSECDYRMKRGEGNLFDGFLLPYLGATSIESLSLRTK